MTEQRRTSVDGQERAEVARYLDYVSRSGAYPRRANAAYFLRQLFSAERLDGARVLDVGGGKGLLSFWAAVHGAREVVCLEPEAAGSSRGIQDRFEAAAHELSLPAARLERATLQAFLAASPARPAFDLVLMHNVVNHLDEPACMTLHHDARAAAVYAGIFEQLAAHMVPGGRLMIADCARTNFWPAVGLRNPFMRAIEWEKHQNPETWAALLGPAGFRHSSTRWSSFNTLGPWGRALLGHRPGAWLTLGHFVSWYERRADPSDALTADG